MNVPNQEFWLAEVGGQMQGPMSLAKLHSLAMSGRIKRSSRVKQLGTQQWIMAGDIPVIFDANAFHSMAVKAASQTRKMQEVPSSQARRASMVPLSQPPAPPQKLVTKRSAPITNSHGMVAVLASAMILVTIIVGIGFGLTRSRSLSESMTSEGNENGSSASASQNTETVVNEIAKYVVVVASKHGHGSGFLCKSGLLITNYHVVNSSELDDVQFFLPDAPQDSQGPFQATLLKEFPERDIAIFDSPVNAKGIELFVEDRFRKGQQVTIIGSPGLFAGETLVPNAVTTGILSGEVELSDLSYYQLSAPINPGNSGGPVLDEKGRAIAVIVAKSLAEESMGLCIPIDSFIDEYNSLVRSRPSSEDLEVIRLVHNARAAVNQTVASRELLGKIMYDFLISSDGNQVEDRSRVDAEILSSIRHRIDNGEFGLFVDPLPLLRSHTSNSALSQNQRRCLSNLMSSYQDFENLYQTQRITIQQLQEKFLEAARVALAVEHEVQLAFQLPVKENR